MPVGFLDRVRFHELSERGARVSGTLALEACPRLVGLVEPAPAIIEAQLTLTVQIGGVPLVRGDIDAHLAMRCQRCLEAMPLRVRSELKLAIVADETQLVPEGYEAFIATDGTGRLADLVEEEILLALPDYPVHGSIEECGELVARVLELEQQEKEPSPFEVLRQLKIDRD